MSQKALFIESKLGSFTLNQSHPIPNPGPSQLLVRVEAVALNPVDWKIQKYGIFLEEYPGLIGTDIAGVVVQVGEEVKDFVKGDRVVFQGAWAKDLAGYQQYTLTNAVTTAKIPSHLSFDQASTIPVAGAVVVAGFYLNPPNGAGLENPFVPSGRGKYAGKPAIVLGGATSVGQFAIQFAKLSGFSPIITTASLKHESFLKDLGATHVLDRHLSISALTAEVHKITSKPIDFIYDAVSLPETQETGYSLLAEGGNLVLVLQSQLKDKDVKEKKNVYSAFGVWTLPHSKDLGALFYSSLSKLLETGDIKPNRVEVVPGGLNGIVAGLKKLEKDEVSGVKLVAHPQETA